MTVRMVGVKEFGDRQGRLLGDVDGSSLCRVSIIKILDESHWQLELISDAYVEGEAMSMVRKQKKG